MRWCGWRAVTIRGRWRFTDQSEETQSDAADSSNPGLGAMPIATSPEPAREAPKQNPPTNPLPIPGVTCGPWGPVAHSRLRPIDAGARIAPQGRMLLALGLARHRRKPRLVEFVVHAVVFALDEARERIGADHTGGPQHDTEERSGSFLASPHPQTRISETVASPDCPRLGRRQQVLGEALPDHPRTRRRSVNRHRESGVRTSRDRRSTGVYTFSPNRSRRNDRTSPKPSTSPNRSACSPAQYSPENKADSGPVSLLAAARFHQRNEGLRGCRPGSP